MVRGGKKTLSLREFHALTPTRGAAASGLLGPAAAAAGPSGGAAGAEGRAGGAEGLRRSLSGLAHGAVVLRLHSTAARNAYEGSVVEAPWRWKVELSLADGGQSGVANLEWLLKTLKLEFGAVAEPASTLLSQPMVVSAAPFSANFFSGSLPDGRLTLDFKKTLRKRPVVLELSVGEGETYRETVVHFDTERLERMCATRREAAEAEAERWLAEERSGGNDDVIDTASGATPAGQSAGLTAEPPMRRSKEDLAWAAAMQRTKPQAQQPEARLADWTPTHVVRWLRKMGLAAHASAFEQHEVDGGMLGLLGQQALEEMGIASELARAKIIRAIQKVQASHGMAGGGAVVGPSSEAAVAPSVVVLDNMRPSDSAASLEVGSAQASAAPLKIRQNWAIKFNELDFGPDGMQRIGIGSYGEVFRAKWQGLPVAVKVLISQQLSKDMLDDFYHEVEVMAALRHPNIALWLGACTEPGAFAMVLELYTFSLAHFLHSPDLRSKVTRARVLAIALGVCRGMQYLHTPGAAEPASGQGDKQRASIVHRDLNPNNVLLASDLRPRITDFGLSRLKTGSKLETRDAAGTPQYTAPEVFRGVYTEKADVYSFGVTLWELMTLEKPYSRQGFARVQVVGMCVSEQHFARSHLMPMLPADTPEAVKGAIASCLAQDPLARPSFEDLVATLQMVVAQQKREK